VPVNRAALVAMAALAGLAVAGCGSSSPKVAPDVLLQQAKQALDGASALHFVLTSSGLPGTGTLVTGGRGDVVRPNKLSGSFDVKVSGFAVSVQVVAAGGKFYAKPPFSSRYTVTDPEKYGLGRPAALIDPNHGVSALLADAQHPTLTGQDRVSGELLDEVSATVTGTEVGQFLPDKAPSVPVKIVAGIAPGSHQLRRVVLTGPFSSATTASKYVVLLENYGEKRTIVAPPS